MVYKGKVRIGQVGSIGKASETDGIPVAEFME